MNRNEFLVCREYASIDLAFSLFNLRGMQEDTDEDEPDRKVLLGEGEKTSYERFEKYLREVLRITGEEEDVRVQLGMLAEEIEPALRELRRDNKARMEFFTALTDRLVAYEYVLNRCELKYSPEKRLDDFLKSNPEDAFLNRLIMYLTRDRDQRVFGTKLQSVIGEIPIQITKNKLFERIDGTFSLYLDSDETALNELIYMLRMAGLVAKTDEDTIEIYPLLKQTLKDFEETELMTMPEERYNLLRDEVFSLSGKLQFIMDYYCELQRCTNDLLSLCLVRKWLPGEDELFGEAEKGAVLSCLDKPDEESLVPLEGRIEAVSERLQRQMAQVEAPDMNGEEEEEYLDIATLARLLSNSMFADIDPLFVESKKVTKETIREKEDVFFEELAEAMKSSQKPVKKAIIAKVLEKLPPFLTSQNTIEEYVRTNLFGCRDKAEKCAVMAILIEMMED